MKNLVGKRIKAVEALEAIRRNLVGRAGSWTGVPFNSEFVYRCNGRTYCIRAFRVYPKDQNQKDQNIAKYGNGYMFVYERYSRDGSTTQKS